MLLFYCNIYKLTTSTIKYFMKVREIWILVFLKKHYIDFKWGRCGGRRRKWDLSFTVGKRYGFRYISFLRVASSKADVPLALTCCQCPMLDFYIIALAITVHALFMWLAIMEKRQAICLSKHIRMHDFKSESPRLVKSYNKCTLANMLVSCSLRRPL